MLKTIILVRHGETEKDKTNPERSLTARGVTQMVSCAKKLEPIINRKNAVIITTNTLRAQRSAQIISKELKIPVVAIFNDLRVENLDLLGEVPNKQLFEKYFEQKGLPKSIPTPKEMAERFMKAVQSQNPSEVVIVVGHGLALESFAYYQERLKSSLANLSELDYSEFIVLS